MLMDPDPLKIDAVHQRLLASGWPLPLRPGLFVRLDEPARFPSTYRRSSSTPSVCCRTANKRR